MATIAGAGFVAAVMAFTASGHVIKTTQFELTTIDAWPGRGSVSAHSSMSAIGHRVRKGIATINAVSHITGTGTVRSMITGAGAIHAVSTITGSGTVGAGIAGKGLIVIQSNLSAKATATLTGSGAISPRATFSARGTATFKGRGVISAVSHFSAVGDEYTIGNKELYVKSDGEWVKIFPPAGVTTEWDGGTW